MTDYSQFDRMTGDTVEVQIHKGMATSDVDVLNPSHHPVEYAVEVRMTTGPCEDWIVVAEGTLAPDERRRHSLNVRYDEYRVTDEVLEPEVDDTANLDIDDEQLEALGRKIQQFVNTVQQAARLAAKAMREVSGDMETTASGYRKWKQRTTSDKPVDTRRLRSSWGAGLTDADWTERAKNADPFAFGSSNGIGPGECSDAAEGGDLTDDYPNEPDALKADSRRFERTLSPTGPSVEVPGEGADTCPRCGGDGEIELFTSVDECGECNGEGTL